MGVEVGDEVYAGPLLDHRLDQDNRPDGTAADVDPTVGNPGLDRIRRVGLIVLALQFIGLVIWSLVLTDRFALGRDFAIYHQAWWLIGHGDFSPFDSLDGFAFISSHGELILWPLALFGALWPHDVTILWIQDAALVGAEVVAFTWMCDLALRRTTRSTAMPVLAAAAGLIILVANPWPYWTISFDFHLEVVGLPFILLAARDLYRDPNSKSIWIWVVLALACGDVVATYLIAIGLSGALAGRKWRTRGLLIATIATIWAVLLTAFGANHGSGLNAGYGYLATASGTPVQLGPTGFISATLAHPGQLTHVLWIRRLDLYAIVSVGGLIGVLSPWAVVATVFVLVENGLNHYLGFIAPGFQNVLLYVLIPVGTVHVLTILMRRSPSLAAIAAALVGINAIGWSAVWLPRTFGDFLRVSSPAASVLSVVRQHIQPGDEVIASQGIIGRFSGRHAVYAFYGSGVLPVVRPRVWVIVSPAQGVETAPVSVSDDLISEMAGPLHATLAYHAAGIWAFRWSPTPRQHSLYVPSVVSTVPAWTTPGEAGQSTTTGPSANWRAVGTGRPGYVIADDFWREPPGHYRATVELSTSVPVNVEVWNATGDLLLARREIPPTNGFQAVSVTCDAERTYAAHDYSGTGPFRILPVSAPDGNRLELRVWTPGGGTVSVSALELTPTRRVGGAAESAP